jgi:dCTP deaminase
MGILSASLMRERLGLKISDPRSFVVTPLAEAAIGRDSLDVRLGSHFLFPPLPAQKAIDIVSRKSSVKDLAVHIPPGRELILPAHQTVLGATLEFIKLPYDVSGQILTKSSVARTFMVIETAPWVHPLYRGCLTLEIANVSNSALVLKPGMPIGQLVLMSIDEPELVDSLSGTYIGPTRPESPLNKIQHNHSVI